MSEAKCESLEVAKGLAELGLVATADLGTASGTDLENNQGFGHPVEDTVNNVEDITQECDEEEDDNDELELGSAESDSDGGSSESEESDTWVSWYCQLRGNEFFCEVDQDYIDDPFNLYGLSSMSYYNEALDVIMDLESELDEEYEPNSDARMLIDNTAETLYGLIHARFILTTQGLLAMNEKYVAGDFGECLRLQCERQALLPIGLSDIQGESTVKTFCPRCREIYLPVKVRQRGIDGAFFGRTFAHLFLMVMKTNIPPTPSEAPFVPTIFGYRIHKSSPYWRDKQIPEPEEDEHVCDEIASLEEAKPDPTSLSLPTSTTPPQPPESKTSQPS